ncbi:MAG: hypothetical protein AAGM84_03710 [Pseudomonadota bacterium]
MIWAAIKWLVTPQRRPLAATQPNLAKREVPLGMEAIDTDLINQVNRRNQSLERTHNPVAQNSRRFGALQNADTDAVIQFADDETYARRFHAAFQVKDDNK